MITEQDLLEAIKECESGVPSLQLCEKLACLYTVYDHLYGFTNNNTYSYDSLPKITEETVKQELDRYGDSDFLSVIEGKEPKEVFSVLDELMDTLQIMVPRLYSSVISKLN